VMWNLSGPQSVAASTNLLTLSCQNALLSLAAARLLGLRPVRPG